MRKIALTLMAIVLAMFCIVGVASAYELIIECPSQIPAGAPLPVTGTTTFPAGTTFDMVFSSSAQTSTQIDSVPVTIGTDQVFNVVFQTTGLKGGMYKVEARLRGDAEAKLSSSSITIKVVELVDRSAILHITSQANQVIPNALLIEGYINKAGNAGVQLDVTGPQGKVFGPAYIGTVTKINGGQDGYFSQRIPVEEPGNYYAKFADSEGYIGQTTIAVTVPPTTVPTVTSDTYVPTVTTDTPHPVTTRVPTPTPTKSPAPVIGMLAGIGAAMLLGSRKTGR